MDGRTFPSPPNMPHPGPFGYGRKFQTEALPVFCIVTRTVAPALNCGELVEFVRSVPEAQPQSQPIGLS